VVGAVDSLLQEVVEGKHFP
jgi:hypothetical protein